MDHEDLVATFGQSVGLEKAEALVAGALERLGIERKDSYTSNEVADVCETIGRSRDGYVRVVANEVWIREQAQRRFDALLSEISDPVVTVSFEDTEPIVAATNPAFEETFGVGSDAVGRSLTDLLATEDDPPESVDRWLRSDGASSTEVTRRTAGGARRTFLFRSVVVSGFDADVEGFGIYTDITERKRRERTLELKNEQLERFASVVSHDLRNPLAVARGNLGLAKDAASDPAVEERLEQVEDAHDKMDGLIEDLLELARQGRTVDDPEPTPLREVVCDAWRTVDTSDVAVSLWGPPNLTVTADEDRLRQLFENLFRNAVKHGSPSREPPDEHATASGPAASEGATASEGAAASSEGATASEEAAASSEGATASEEAAAASEGTAASDEETAGHGSADGLDGSNRPEGPDSGIDGAAVAGNPDDESSPSVESDGRGSSAVATLPASERRLDETESLRRVAVLESGIEQTGWGATTRTDAEVTLRVEWSAGVLAVEDDGPGIPPEEREQVFEHGYTTSDDGTGFGLAIVQAIAEAHSWTVSVTDGREGGARFEFDGVTRASGD